MDFTVPVDYSVKMKENEMIHKYLDLAKEQKSCWMMVLSIVLRALGTISKGKEKDFKNYKSEEESRLSRHWNVEIDQNTQKSPQKLKKLAVCQTPVKNSKSVK